MSALTATQIAWPTYIVRRQKENLAVVLGALIAAGEHCPVTQRYAILTRRYGALEAELLRRELAERPTVADDDEIPF